MCLPVGWKLYWSCKFLFVLMGIIFLGDFYLHLFWVVFPVPLAIPLVTKVLFLDIAFTSWPHLWFQISNSIAYFFLQLVEAKRNKANRTCTTTKHETGTQWSICTSNRRDRRIYHVTSAVLVPSVESASILSFSCNTGRQCTGNTSICLRWSKTQFPLYVTWRVSCALPSSFA